MKDSVSAIDQARVIGGVIHATQLSVLLRKIWKHTSGLFWTHTKAAFLVNGGK